MSRVTRRFLIRHVIAATTDRKPNVNRKRRFHGTHSDRSKVFRLSPRTPAVLRALVTVTLGVYNGPSSVRIFVCLSSRLRVRKDYGE